MSDSNRFHILITRNIGDLIPFQTEFYYVEPHRSGDAPRCPQCGDFVGPLQPLPPFNVALELWDRGYGDLAFGPGDHMLVSDRFRILWQEHGLSGLKPFAPVTIKKVKRHRGFRGDPPAYFLTSVVRSEAVVDLEGSRFEWVEDEPPKCNYCLLGGPIKRWKRILIKPDTWQGQNMFRARGLAGRILVDDKFKEFAGRFRITNCQLVPAEQHARDFYS